MIFFIVHVVHRCFSGRTMDGVCIQFGCITAVSHYLHRWRKVFLLINCSSITLFALSFSSFVFKMYNNFAASNITVTFNGMSVTKL